ncbi:MAG: hypothetical protein SPI16_03000 [Porphyromonas sp.]|uniref:hypothetical protein n=1 Tax=Porphyromonas sp. TaxID=1924944 RepID=UPI002A9205A5|nr:hypothetical protein [Porphyromonas sp.]MDD7468625.1 hypothetical protein [Bacteroidales bacterium]MDY6101999.1 hypothetical protein [Porphyromonas sp.]
MSFTSPTRSRRGFPAVPLLIHPALDRSRIHPYAGGRRIPSGIPGTGEYRIELDRVR